MKRQPSCRTFGKVLGAKQSIIHLSTTEYIPTIQEIGAGVAISKNLSTVNAILREIIQKYQKNLL